MIIFFALACTVSKGLDTAENIQEDTFVEVDPITLIDPTTLPAASNPCREPVLVDVNYVVDGDTVFVQAPQGEEKVRFIGIDTAELGYDGEPDECYAQEARDFLIDLIDERKVWLSFDALCEDTFGRTLAYVHTSVGSQGFVQRQMIQRGMAKDFPFDDTPAFREMFAEDALQAQQAGIGGWGACGWD
ncbi:MAG: hypothetical protein CL916_06600 [Deltaproteobacteria bacterium]|nr:hypothetical protein [Deltaproteobacteria bacterium]